MSDTNDNQGDTSKKVGYAVLLLGALAVVGGYYQANQLKLQLLFENGKFWMGFGAVVMFSAIVFLGYTKGQVTRDRMQFFFVVLGIAIALLLYFFSS